MAPKKTNIQENNVYEEGFLWVNPLNPMLCLFYALVGKNFKMNIATAPEQRTESFFFLLFRYKYVGI